ncbi:recombinase family protein [Catenulispora rubra]|uniref:recombinase family protein n=1 Tax=Catenulispora rubra TaxID=280293 RepID=UPI0018921ECE|nr:recombinase family protein [Catenulispora rubra]
MITTEYDGCGKCLVGVRRLSRKVDATSSPERQRDQVLEAVTAVDGHVIAWADDWEVSGATNPLDRPALGPWLRGEMGPYAGIAGAAVDRIGRNQRDVLNTGYMMKDEGRLLVTFGHPGPWDLDDSSDEMRFSMEAFGAQMELRAIQRRNRDETLRARTAGQPKQKNAYGYRFVRLIPTGKVDHVAIDETAAEVIRTVAERLLADETGNVTPSTEAVRLTRTGVLSPADHRAVMYGRQPKGSPWTPKALRDILTSEAALGYLMHGGRPVLGPDGHPRRIAPPLWDRATRDALVAKCAPKRDGKRAPKGVSLLSGLGYCGTCGQKLYIAGRTGGMAYGCTSRVRGVPAAADCQPAPTIAKSKMDEIVTEWFLNEYGRIPLFRREYDPGTGHAARIAELEADRARLREDRSAGLYDHADDAKWFREHYARMGAEIEQLKALPDRPASMQWVMTGLTVADQWSQAADNAERREILADYQIRAVLFPRRGNPQRVWVHGLDPDTATEIRSQAAAAATESTPHPVAGVLSKEWIGHIPDGAQPLIVAES